MRTDNVNAYNTNESYDSYRSIDLESRAATASPYQLVLVLFDGLLDELARARGHIENKRYQQKGQSLEKCLNILNGLNSALDYDNGGDLIQGLSRLYDYCIYRLSDVSVSLSLEGLDEVVTLVGVLREGWDGVNAARG
jgi:flagellar protein FliS